MRHAHLPHLLAKLSQLAVPGSPDAARWTPALQQDDDWRTASALLVTAHGASMIALPPGNHETVLRQRVGNPRIHRLQLVSTVEFWVGASTTPADDLNPLATRLIQDLVSDIATGEYAAADADQARARTLMTSARGRPRIVGGCVITGIAHDQPTHLPSPFLDWFLGWTHDTITTLVHSIADAAAHSINTRLAAAAVPFRVRTLVLGQTDRPHSDRSRHTGRPSMMGLPYPPPTGPGFVTPVGCPHSLQAHHLGRVSNDELRAGDVIGIQNALGDIYYVRVSDIDDRPGLRHLTLDFYGQRAPWWCAEDGIDVPARGSSTSVFRRDG